MKFKWRLWSGPTFAAVILAWCVLAYIFMWRPICRPYGSGLPWWNAFGRARAISSSYPCINNLRQIEAAINEWALENHKTNGTSVTFEDIKPFIKLNSQGEIPNCPYGGKYSITVVGTAPTCSFGINQPERRIRIGHFYYQDVGGKNAHFHQLP
jgi:hypothetical protein